MRVARVLNYFVCVFECVVGLILGLAACLICFFGSWGREASIVIFRKALRYVGPVPVKLTQIVGNHRSDFPGFLVPLLDQAYEDVEPLPIRKIEGVLRKEFGSNFSGLRLSSRSPLGVGSIAQVHHATFRDAVGTVHEVAVKVVKPRTEEAIQMWTLLMLLVSRLLCIVSKRAKRFDIDSSVRTISNALADQSRMDLELSALQRFQSDFDGHEYVEFPGYYETYCSSRVLTMDFLETRDLMAGATEDRSLIGYRLQEIVYTMIFTNAFFHADPHQGNFRLGEDNRIVIFDFGLVCELDSKSKLDLATVLFAAFRGEWESATDRVLRHFIVQEVSRETHPSLADKIKKIVLHHFDERHDKWRTLEFVAQVEVAVNSEQLSLTKDLDVIALTLTTGEGLLNLIDPDIDIWENARRYTVQHAPILSDRIRNQLAGVLESEIPKTIGLLDDVRRYCVAPTHLDRFVFPSEYPLILEKADGAFVYDVDGNRYLDVSCGFGPNILGYRNSVQTRAFREALEVGQINAIAHNSEHEFAQLLCETLPYAEQVLFTNSGTESVLSAIRICRAYTRNTMIAKFEGHYHGFSDQGIVSSWFAFGGTRTSPEPCAGSIGCDPETTRQTLLLKYGEERELEKLVENRANLACVICEPFPSATLSLDKTFLKRLLSVCKSIDLPVVFDEVVSGFRISYGGAQELLGECADLTCLGKILGGGMPMGAVAGREKYLRMVRSTGDPFEDVSSRAFCGGTMSGNQFATTAGKRTVEYLWRNPSIYRDLARETNFLKKEISKLATKYDVPMRARGMNSIVHIDFGSSERKVARDVLERGYYQANAALAYYMRKNGVYIPELHTIMLSAAHQREEIEFFLHALSLSLESMAADDVFNMFGIH